MKTTSLTISRNKQIVGNNCKSYNDKHPEKPIALRPIRDALKAARAHRSKNKWTPRLAFRAQDAYVAALYQKINRLRNLGRPAIARGITQLTLR